MRSTFGVSPIPNQAMNKKSRAGNGMVRNIWRVESSNSSPRANRPTVHAQMSPVPAPIARPTVARTSETPMSTQQVLVQEQVPEGAPHRRR